MFKEQITITTNSEKDKNRKQGDKRLDTYGTILVIIESIIFVFPFTNTAKMLGIEYQSFWIVTQLVIIPLYIIYVVLYIKHFKKYYLNNSP